MKYSKDNLENLHPEEYNHQQLQAIRVVDEEEAMVTYLVKNLGIDRLKKKK